MAIPPITTIPPAGSRGVDLRDAFVTKQEAFQDALVDTTVDELNTAFLAVDQSVADTAGDVVLTHADVVLTNADVVTAGSILASTETARDVAFSSANYSGVWDDTTDFGLTSVAYLGLVYASLQSPNINQNPLTQTAYWQPLTKEVSIDERVDHLAVTAMDYTSGNLDFVTYVGGYKNTLTYTKPELITNGDFPTATTGWTLTQTLGTISVATGELLFTQGATAEAMKASQAFTTIVGLSYTVTMDILTESGALSALAVNIGTTLNGSEISASGGITVQSFSVTFVATATTTYVTMEDNQALTETSTWDNVSCIEVTPANSLCKSEYFDAPTGTTLVLTEDLHYIGDNLYNVDRTEA